jgi:hypothetical protein
MFSCLHSRPALVVKIRIQPKKDWCDSLISIYHNLLTIVTTNNVCLYGDLEVALVKLSAYISCRVKVPFVLLQKITTSK